MARFLKSYFFVDTVDNSRFREGDEPTEQEFRNLFDSVAFIREKNDTAKLNEQGLAKCTEDLNAELRDSSEGPDQMKRFIQAHQLPNVLTDMGSGIGITILDQVTGRTGGAGRDFKISNLQRLTGTLPITIVGTTNSTTGIVTYAISLDPTALSTLETGKVKVTENDTTADYLLFSLESLNPNIALTSLSPGGNERVGINWVERVGEVKMFAGNAATVFAGSYNNTPGHVWRGWALCDGGTYNSILTPDMRGYVPIGYNPDVTTNPKYSTILGHADDTVVSGTNTHILTRAQLPKHVHMLTTGVDNASQSDPGNHTHSYNNWPNQANIGATGTSATDNSLETAQNTGSAGAHTHTGNTGDGTSDPGSLGGLNGAAHENRQPFTVLAFVVYVGF